MMKVRNSRLGALVAVLLAPCFLTGVAWGQDGTFTLGFDVPAQVTGGEGDVVSFDGACTLTQEGISDPSTLGAKGWSISFGVENCTVLDITTSGTDLETLFGLPLGFEVSEVVDPTKNGGQEGAVSAIVINLVKNIVLSENKTYSIASLGLETTIADGGSSRLFYVDGLKGSGEPVPNNVTQGGQTITPVLGEETVTHAVISSCCDAIVNLGFSAELISSPVVFDGIANAEQDPPICAAAGGLITGGPGTLEVYGNIISQIDGAGAQGWSTSISYEGDISLIDATTAGTALSIPEFDPLGFDVTQLVDPAKNGGKQGAVSAVVLGLVKAKNLPAVGTESVLRITLNGELGQTGQLTYESGLVGEGEPVPNNVTVAGTTESPCNGATAQVNLEIVEPPFGKFIRGNANDDAKVDIADPIWIINELFRGGEATLCQDAADANDDALVDLSDATYLIDYLFLGGPMPPTPFPACDADPDLDDDGLTCETTQQTCP